MILLCYPRLHVTSWMAWPHPSHTPVPIVRPRAALSWSFQFCLLNEHLQQARPTKTQLPGLGCCLGFCQAWFGSQSTLPSSPKENTGLALQQARVPRLFSAIIGKRPVKDPSKPPSCTLPSAPFPRSDFSKIPTNSQMLFSSLRNAFPHMVFSQSPEQHSYKVSPSLKILKREQFLIPPFWLSVQHTQRVWGLQEAAEMQEKLVRTEVQGLRLLKPGSVGPHAADGGRRCWVPRHHSTTSSLAWRATSWSQTRRPCFLHLCMCAQSLQSCPTLCALIDRSSPDSSVHGTFQARRLEWVAMPSSKGSSQPRD